MRPSKAETAAKQKRNKIKNINEGKKTLRDVSALLQEILKAVQESEFSNDHTNNNDNNDDNNNIVDDDDDDNTDRSETTGTSPASSGCPSTGFTRPASTWTRH